MNMGPLCSRKDSAAGFGGTRNVATGWRKGCSHGVKKTDAPRLCRVQGPALVKRTSYILTFSNSSSAHQLDLLLNCTPDLY